MKIDLIWAYQVMLVIKDPSTNAGDIRGKGSIPELGSSPGGGHGNPLQYSCLENPMDGGAWHENSDTTERPSTECHMVGLI